MAFLERSTADVNNRAWNVYLGRSALIKCLCIDVNKSLRENNFVCINTERAVSNGGYLLSVDFFWDNDFTRWALICEIIGVNTKNSVTIIVGVNVVKEDIVNHNTVLGWILG